MARIHSIYPATEGEGVRIGTSLVFVRFQGCALGCKNCDSKETWSFAQGEELSVEQIVEQVCVYNLEWVSITGGNPLDAHHREDVLELIKRFKNLGKKINLEATGQEFDQNIFAQCDFISVDIKTPSTGVVAQIDVIKQLVAQFATSMQIKCVISSAVDFDFAYQCYAQLAASEVAWIMTPACSVEDPLSKENFIWIMEENLKRGGKFRVIGQQHKWVYGQERLDV